jgi:mono/diheme cytochrome c family protein
MPRALALLALLAGPAAAESRLPSDDPARVAAGAAIYDAHCAACHGAELEGEPDWRRPGPDGRLPAPPHDATGHTWHHADAVLIDIVTRGTEAVVGGGYRSNMPGFGDVLSPREIRDVLAYIRSTWPPRVQEIHDEVNAAARAAE